jgi:hypothetical protein
MNPARRFAVIKVALVATAMTTGFAAQAGPSASSPGMARAFARADEGPNALRRFIERTKPIYNLDYAEVATAYESRTTPAVSLVRLRAAR